MTTLGIILDCVHLTQQHMQVIWDTADALLYVEQCVNYELKWLVLAGTAGKHRHVSSASVRALQRLAAHLLLRTHHLKR